MEFGKETLIVVLLVWNLITFIVMGIDKRKAVKDKKRIRESSLLMLAFFFGGVGILGGMIVFLHKTKKPLFIISLIVALIINVLLITGAFTLLKGIL